MARGVLLLDIMIHIFLRSVGVGNWESAAVIFCSLQLKISVI